MPERRVSNMYRVRCMGVILDSLIPYASRTTIIARYPSISIWAFLSFFAIADVPIASPGNIAHAQPVDQSQDIREIRNRILNSIRARERTLNQELNEINSAYTSLVRRILQNERDRTIAAGYSRSIEVLQSVITVLVDPSRAETIRASIDAATAFIQLQNDFLQIERQRNALLAQSLQVYQSRMQGVVRELREADRQRQELATLDREARRRGLLSPEPQRDPETGNFTTTSPNRPRRGPATWRFAETRSPQGVQAIAGNCEISTTRGYGLREVLDYLASMYQRTGMRADLSHQINDEDSLEGTFTIDSETITTDVFSGRQTRGPMQFRGSIKRVDHDQIVIDQTGPFRDSPPIQTILRRCPA